MKTLLASLFAALVAAGGAVAADDLEPKKSISKADQARARAVQLRASDFPASWQSTPAEKDGDDDLDCPGFRVDESDLTVTGDSESRQFSLERRATLTFLTAASAATVYKTARQAGLSWTRGVRPGLERCLAAAIRKEALSDPDPSVKLQSVRVMERKPPKVAQRQAAYRVVAKLTSQGLGFSVYGDFVLLGQKRVLGVLFYVSALSPPRTAEVNRLAGVMAGRMAKTFP